MLQILLITGFGAVIGGIIGTMGNCESGACPLTASPWRGGIFGAVAGLAIGLSSIGSMSSSNQEQLKQAADKKHPNLIVITSEKQFKKEVLESKLPVIVDFYADWCPPCQMLLPVMSKVADTWKGKVKIVKVNVDKNPQLSTKYGVRSIPDVRFIKAGKQVAKEGGYAPEDIWNQKIKEIFKLK